MNLENLDTLIRALRTMQAVGNEQRLNMEFWFSSDNKRIASALYKLPEQIASADPSSCGTAACLAGWCQLLGAKSEAEKEMCAMEFGEDWLGLDLGGSFNLFFGKWINKPLSCIILAEALAYLESLRPQDHAEPASAERHAARELVDA